MSPFSHPPLKNSNQTDIFVCVSQQIHIFFTKSQSFVSTYKRKKKLSMQISKCKHNMLTICNHKVIAMILKTITTNRDESRRIATNRNGVAMRRDSSQFVATGRRDRSAKFFFAAVVTEGMLLYACYLQTVWR